MLNCDNRVKEEVGWEMGGRVVWGRGGGCGCLLCSLFFFHLWPCIVTLFVFLLGVIGRLWPVIVALSGPSPLYTDTRYNDKIVIMII